MKTKYDYNPLELFSNTLYDALSEFILKPTVMNYVSVEPLLKTILLNNGCAFTDRAIEKMVEITSDYTLCFIIGAKGNEVNECYDFIELYGMQYLVIFLDSFKGIKTGNAVIPDKDKLSPDEVVSYGLNTLMGNSAYFDDIKKIVDIFTLTMYNPAIQTQSLQATSAAGNYRWAGAIIAGKILNSFRPLTENDVSGISLEELMKIINSNMGLGFILSGIRVK